MSRTYLLVHRHSAVECAAAFAAWSGSDSPLRHHTAVSSCASGGHEIWWRVAAGDEQEALAQLPSYVAKRTKVVHVRDVMIP